LRTHRYDTPGPVDLQVTIKSGRVHVETWDGADTVVDLDSSDDALVEEVNVDCEPFGDGYRVVVRVPRMEDRNFLRIFSRSSLDVHVHVPHQARAEVTTASGDVRLNGSYREVQASTASGDVEVDDVTGLASIATASGDISVHSVAGRTDIRAASADVHCGRMEGGGEVKTASGDVRIDAAAERIAVTTGSGDISVGESDSCKLRSASGDLSLSAIREGVADLKTASGDIDVAVVTGAVVAVDAESVSGDLTSEIELSLSEPSTAGGDETDREIELILRTVNGDIQVRRTRARAGS